MSAGIFSTPRPLPGRAAPAVAGSAVVALALPLFLVAGWPLRGWAVAACLWLATQALALLLARRSPRVDSLAAALMRGLGSTSRVLLAGVPLVVLTVADEPVGLAAALVFAAAYTVELLVGLVSYFGGEART
ncbi:MAG: hypothetical protein RMM28_04280 [Thermoleophilia bacterium]|nr:hypothetical protein [Gaiellaceae bacterium]MDW8338339.1 hypothetical protein [Thermoleophilia bacterium]